MQEFHFERAQSLMAGAELIYDDGQVQTALAEMAGKLNAYFTAGDTPQFPLVLGVMGGAVVFTGQLLTKLNFPLEFDYIHVTRYGENDSGGKVVWKVVPRSNVVGRTVVVLDDILDEGHTLAEVKNHLLEMGASEVLVAVFADKELGRKKPIQADYVGLTVPNKFIVGFGMDAYGYWRNLPGIWAIQPVSVDK